MESIDLFPSRIYKFKLDPSSYEREKILETVINNYKKDHKRNKWDTASSLHHYYNDWNNDNFDQVPLTSLVNVYQEKISELMNSINPKIKYEWSFVNITVNTAYMKPHQHLGREGEFECVYSGVHYLKYNKNIHTSTRFYNPTLFGQFNYLTDGISQLLDRTSISNSSFFENWNLEIEEDDFVLFPAYLKHDVMSDLRDNEYRITSVVNLNWKTY